MHLIFVFHPVLLSSTSKLARLLLDSGSDVYSDGAQRV